MGETFTQENCSVAPCHARGWVIPDAGRIAPCIVRVADGELTIIRGEIVLKSPASALEIVSPVLRKLFALVILRVNGKLLAVEFGFVHTLNKLLGSRQRGILWAVRVWSSTSYILAIPRMRLGRRLAAEFTAALLAAGALES